MCGTPASGKTSYVKAHAKPEDLVVSRDEIRFSMLTPGIPYFSKEKEVFREFCKRINEGIDVYDTVWADATHISNASRWKLLRNINANAFEEIVFVSVETPLEECLLRNSAREGLAQVPEDSIRSMAASYRRPSVNDFLSLDNVKIEVINND